MSSQFAMAAMTGLEFLLSASLGFVFWKKKLHRRFPAMGGYLGLRVLATPALTLLYILSSESQWVALHRFFRLGYFFVYWPIYLCSAVLLFLVSMEVFRSALAGLPGLMKFGVVIFRWAALVSAIVTLSSIPFAHRGILMLPDVAIALMRSVSLLELCLLAFLCLSMNALRLSVRDLGFGIALGFGVMSANDFIFASVTSRYASLTAPLQFFYESAIMIGLATWMAYSALPEPVRPPVTVSANSTIFRWNEIASALGHTGTQVAVQPANSFFLTDVEKVVEKVISRSLKSRESEL